MTLDTDLFKPSASELRKMDIKRKLIARADILGNSALRLKNIAENINCASEPNYMKSLKDFRVELENYNREFDQFYKTYFVRKNLDV
jgi:hypothetical protein